jgi:DNA topoisomerase-1
MSKTLVIVESPSKVKKIQSYLGDNYLVSSSMGHFRGLDPKKMSVDIDNNYNLEFIDIPEKKDTIANIKKLYKTCSGGVLLASDGDFEGAAIAYHVFELLNVKPEKRYRIIFNEITQKAITESLNKKALIDMNEVHTQFGRMCLDKVLAYSLCPLLWKEFNNFHLACGRVMSPVIRLIIEREEEISKFQSSPFFKLNANFVLDKKELTKLSKTKNNTNTNTNNIIQTTCDDDINDKSIIEKLYKDISEDKVKFIIKSLSKNNSTRSPPPPFITSSLQQAASILLGYSPDTTMKLSQKLYESSLITYMRTDSPSIAEDAMISIKKQIESKFGSEYYKRTVYKTKSTSAQQAHECIRPINFTTESILNIEGITPQHNKLYQLIYRRTLSSQMSPTTLEIRTLKISTGEKKKDQIVFTGKHEKVIFEGFLKAQNMHKSKSNKTKINVDNDEIENSSDDENKVNDDENKVNVNDDEENEKNENNEIKSTNEDYNKYLETIFDKIKENQEVFTQSMNCNEKYSKPKQSRYTEASLISAMEKLGIGRPSTYSSVTKKIQEKEYIERKSLPAKKVNLTSLNFTYPDKIKIETKEGKIEGDKNKLIVSSLGIMINQYLVKNFPEIMDYKYTANIESLLDEIAEGKKTWTSVVDTMYKKILPIITTLSQALKARKALKSADPTADSAFRRNLGINPLTNLPVFAIKSRKGFLIIEENPDKKQSRFANFSSLFENMTLDTALTLLIFPRCLGKYKDHDIILKKASNIYIQYNNSNYSIENYMKANPKIGLDTEKMSFDEAKVILEYYEKSKADKIENDKKDKKLNDDITIKTGPFGLYLKLTNNTNVKLPKKYKDNIDSLTLEEALVIIENDKTKPKSGRGKSAPKAKVKAKPKVADKTTKPKKEVKEVKEVKEKVKKETKPKEKVPKPIKIKQIKTKF